MALHLHPVHRTDRGWVNIFSWPEEKDRKPDSFPITSVILYGILGDSVACPNIKEINRLNFKALIQHNTFLHSGMLLRAFCSSLILNNLYRSPRYLAFNSFKRIWKKQRHWRPHPTLCWYDHFTVTFLIYFVNFPKKNISYYGDN